MVAGWKSRPGAAILGSRNSRYGRASVVTSGDKARNSMIYTEATRYSLAIRNSTLRSSTKRSPLPISQETIIYQSLISDVIWTYGITCRFFKRRVTSAMLMISPRNIDTATYPAPR